MIVDASVVFKWLTTEDGTPQALALISREPLFAPTLLLMEIGNALWKQARREQVDPSVSFEDDLAGLATLISIVDERPYVSRAMAMARALDHPIYDCVYLAMAEMKDRVLITADKKFIACVRGSPWRVIVEELA